MYNPYFNNAFSNYNSPYINNPVSTGLGYNAQSCKQEIVKVNGENGARAYQMQPNSSALLLDETQPVIWLKQTDGAGYPTINAYRIEPFTVEAANTSNLEKRVRRLEEFYESYTSKSSEQSRESAQQNITD